MSKLISFTDERSDETAPFRCDLCASATTRWSRNKTNADSERKHTVAQIKFCNSVHSDGFLLWVEESDPVSPEVCVVFLAWKLLWRSFQLTRARRSPSTAAVPTLYSTLVQSKTASQSTNNCLIDCSMQLAITPFQSEWPLVQFLSGRILRASWFQLRVTLFWFHKSKCNKQW